MTAPCSDSLPRLAAVDGPLRGHVFDLDRQPWTIGRAPGNRLTVDDPSLSRRHCRIEFHEDAFRLVDQDSHNGTFVNGRPVHDQVLAEGDEVKAGHSIFRFLLAPPNVCPGLPSVRFESSQVEQLTVLLHVEPGRALPKLSAVTAYQALLQVTAALHANRGPGPLAAQLLDTLLEVVPADRGAVLLFHAPGEEPSLACTRDRILGADAPVDVNRAAVDQAFREATSVLSGGRFVAAPLFSREKPVGVLYLDSDAAKAVLREEHLQFVSAVGIIAGAVLEDAQEFTRLEQENRRLDEEIAVRHEMVGDSPGMQEVYRMIARAAPTDSTVLILGETGTGKELVARAIHRNSSRANGPFVAINCAALTETLLESELFGHERGAFTGAVTQKRGKLEMADHGTVFLDEIGELPAALQTKLLRVLQEREFERVGGTRPIHVDLRILAATNRDLRAAIEKKTFRDDLYYRLNVIAIRLPALRDRRDDIPLLASYFLDKRVRAGQRGVSGISDRARACLMNYDWPGNIRELEHAIESALVLGTGKLIQAEDLPEAILDGAPANSLPVEGYHGTVKQEKAALIVSAIERAGGNITEAARHLKLHPNYLHRLIRNLNLRPRIARTGV